MAGVREVRILEMIRDYNLYMDWGDGSVFS